MSSKIILKGLINTKYSHSDRMSTSDVINGMLYQLERLQMGLFLTTIKVADRNFLIIKDINFIISYRQIDLYIQIFFNVTGAHSERITFFKIKTLG
jgi:hypothetical protein